MSVAIHSFKESEKILNAETKNKKAYMGFCSAFTPNGVSYSGNINVAGSPEQVYTLKLRVPIAPGKIKQTLEKVALDDFMITGETAKYCYIEGQKYLDKKDNLSVFVSYMKDDRGRPYLTTAEIILAGVNKDLTMKKGIFLDGIIDSFKELTEKKKIR